MKLQSNKRNHSIYLPVHGCQNKCLTVCPSLALCAFRLSVWKLFVPILRRYCMFFLFGNSLQNSQKILFSFPSNLSHLYLPPCLLVLACFFFFLVKAGVSDAVVISLSSDDGFPPKKEYSEPCTYFRFDILWLTF